MYCESRILERLAQSRKVIGWTPERHSIEEVEKFTASIKDLEFTPTRSNITYARVEDLTQKQKDFITNEVHMCACDAAYYLERYAFIKDEQNTIVRFRWRAPQRVGFSIIADMEAGRHSIEIQWLKGRQLGVSTLIELLITHRILFGYGVNAVAASIDDDKSAKMAQMMDLCIEYTPWWLKPTKDIPWKTGKVYTFANKCSINIHSGKAMSGIARGTTPTCIHLSELADYPNPADIVEASLFHAVHPSPKVFMHLESTGNSNVGWWADTWRFNKKNWHKGAARLRPVFLPWFMGTDIYPMPTWLHDHPLPEGWEPCNETRAHVAKCNAYANNTDYLRKELGPNWKLPREQAWFWECNYLERKAKRTEKKWIQEMPADDNEALQSKQEKVFPYEVLARIEEDRQKEYEAFAIVGEGIEDKFNPIDTDIDYSKPRIPISFYNKTKDTTYYWFLIPLLTAGMEDEENRKWNGTLLVYERPVAGQKYSAAVDTAGGGGKDRFVTSVTHVEEGMVPDFQAAEMASDQINAAEATAFVMAICAWYDVEMMACEQVRKPGDTCQVQMRLMGWPNSRVHSMVRYDNKKVQKGKALKKGWYTHGWSRPLLLTMYIAAVENGWYKPNSPFLKSECENFEAHETDGGKTKMEHMQGKHDDRLFASAISYFIVHDLDLMTERSKKRYMPPKQNSLPPINMEPCQLNVVPFAMVVGRRWDSFMKGAR